MSARDEHLATRRSAGLFDFSFMGLYEFSSQADLQPLQSRDLSALEPGRILYTLLLNEDGGVFNDATIWHMGGERYWLWTGRRSDYARFGRVARDRSGEFAVLALQGPDSGRTLARLAGPELVRALPYFRFVQKEAWLVARLGYSGELGYEILMPAGEQEAFRARVQDVPRCSFEAANSLRIESGYLLFDREIDGRANPRELGLERLVSGQRAFSFGRKLVGLELKDEYLKDIPTAELTSECFSPTLNKPIGLGFVAPGVPAGQPVRLADGRAARVAALPFVDQERRRPRASPL